MTKIVKATKVRLYPTASKLERLKGTLADFTDALNTAIDCYWKLDKVKGRRPPKELRLSGRVGSDASVLAWQIVKSAKKRKGSKPEIKNPILVLNEASGRITGYETKEFDLWFSIMDSRNKYHRVLVPGRKTKHLNKLLSEGYKLRKDIKIKLKGEKIFAYLTLVKEAPPIREGGEVLGADIGYRKLLTLSNGEKFGEDVSDLIDAYHKRNVRCPRTVRHYINRILKLLPWSQMKVLVVENLKHLKKHKKGKWSKEVNRRFNSWCYGYLLSRLGELSRENGVLLMKVNPKDTSRECPKCRHVEPGNRNGEVFRCKKCGYEGDADWVGALNVLRRFSVPTAGSVAVPKAGNICL